MVKDKTVIEKEDRIEELGQQLKHATELLDKCIDTIWKLDPQLQFTFVSPSIYDTFGYTQEEWIGTKLSEHTPFCEYVKMGRKALNAIKTRKVSGPAELFETALYHKNGSLVEVEIVAKAVFNENGDPVGLIGSTRNISDRKKTERELVRKTAQLRASNVAKDKFFSIVAHDLKNPFNALIGFSNLLEEEVEQISNDNIVRFSSHINKTLLKTYEYLNNLLEWSRLQSTKSDIYRSVFNVKALVHNTLDMLFLQAQKKKITLRISIGEQLTAYADRKMIQTVVVNLLSNAIKYSPEGKEILIEAKSEGNKVLVSVRDHGVGIHPSILENLFNIEKSVSTPGTHHETGTGLGLILCKEFISKNQGTIGVESTQWKGSLFWFRIPAKA